MGKNTSTILNQNSNNLWTSINTNNSDWLKNEEKNLNFNQNINKSTNSNNQSNNTSNNNNNNINNSSVSLNHLIQNSTFNVNESINKNLMSTITDSNQRFYDNLLKSNSQNNLNNYQQQQQQQNLQLNNKTDNMNPSFLESLSGTAVSPMINNLNNKINLMDMPNNKPNPSNTPKLFNNKEDGHNYYLNSLNNNSNNVSNYMGGGDSNFLNKNELFEDTANNSNREYYLSNNISNTDIEQDINAINSNDYFSLNNNKIYNIKNNYFAIYCNPNLGPCFCGQNSPSLCIPITCIKFISSFNNIIGHPDEPLSVDILCSNS